MATRKNGKSLVIVESPAKARTISRILGAKYDVKASVGHVRDLPKSALGVDVENGFEPKYVVPRDKASTVKDIKAAAAKASEVFLATDPDREGEAIAWHLVEAAGLNMLPLHRVVFHEITADAVQEAFNHPREIDMKLVDAQQARRVVDRLIGYRLSPFLWRKVRRGLAAGRVQSVAVRLVVDREREIQNFKAQEYWTIEALLEKAAAVPAFRAKLAGYANKKDKLEIADGESSARLISDLRSAAYEVAKVQTRTQVRRPTAPFITSTLQQEASRRLAWTAKRTMAIAQQLYEGIALGSRGETGLITYMRTDSTNVASSAQAEARDFIANRYGKQFIPEKPRVYTRKVKGAQEAHEAIRPTSVMREPDAMRGFLSPDQVRLYTLIWQRFVASQMADALFDVTTVDINATPLAGADVLLLRATNTQLKFAGFRQVYEEARDDEPEEDIGSNPLPGLSEADALLMRELFPEQHFTEPPPRYTEATLVKTLEEKGIGRPSTYAPTMSTIQDRGYIDRDKKQLKPTDLGFTVNDLLVEYFDSFLDVDFTAEMEVELDDVATGDREWRPVVRNIYEPLESALAGAMEAAPKQVQETGEFCPDPQGVHSAPSPLIIRWGKRGQFIACSGWPECKYTRNVDGDDDEQGLITEEMCPNPDHEKPTAMVVRSGRFGKFLACSQYPECKNRRSLAQSTGAKCPKTGGDILERRSKRGRTFYGCADFPKCDFTSWTKPFPQPCPNCGKLIVGDKDNMAKCTECDWRGPAPAS